MYHRTGLVRSGCRTSKYGNLAAFPLATADSAVYSVCFESSEELEPANVNHFYALQIPPAPTLALSLKADDKRPMRGRRTVNSAR